MLGGLTLTGVDCHLNVIFGVYCAPRFVEWGVGMCQADAGSGLCMSVALLCCPLSVS
jgi:hypothetical protein